MFNKKRCFLALFLICMGHSSAWDRSYSRPAVETSSTLEDLNAAANTQAQSLEEFFESIKDRQGSEFEPLKVGQDLFRRAMIIEENLKSSNYTVWWRVSDKAPERDMLSMRETGERSFGVSLLAGYKCDGMNVYGQTFHCAPNSSACVYIYYANALYAQSVLSKRLVLAQDFLNFIEANEFLADRKGQILALEEAVNNLTERAVEFEAKKQEGMLASHIRESSAAGERRAETYPIYPFTTTESKLLLDLTISIQEDSKYDASRHRATVNELYGRRYNLYCGDEKDITNAALNNVYALIFPKATASLLINREIEFRTEAVLYGRGEKFHPRIPLEKYKELNGKVIKVYSELQLIDEETLKQEVARIIQ